MSKQNDKEVKWLAVVKAQAQVERKAKEALSKLDESDKARKSAEAAIAGFKK